MHEDSLARDIASKIVNQNDNIRLLDLACNLHLFELFCSFYYFLALLLGCDISALNRLFTMKCGLQNTKCDLYASGVEIIIYHVPV